MQPRARARGARARPTGDRPKRPFFLSLNNVISNTESVEIQSINSNSKKFIKIQRN